MIARRGFLRLLAALPLARFFPLPSNSDQDDAGVFADVPELSGNDFFLSGTGESVTVEYSLPPMFAELFDGSKFRRVTIDGYGRMLDFDTAERLESRGDGTVGVVT